MNILKKIICGILTTTIGFAALSFNTVSAIRSGDYDYEILSNGTACLTAYHGTEPNLVLPAQIDGKLVAACAISFENANYLQTLNFPSTIISLGASINGDIRWFYVFFENYKQKNIHYIHFNNIADIRNASISLADSGEIYAPSSVKSIFYNRNFSIPFFEPLVVEPGSYAEQWAIEEQYPYRLDNREWLQDNNGLWYLRSNDKTMYGWHRMNDKMYYLDPNQRGMLLTGWQYLGNAWYYLDPLNGGAVASGWLQPDKSTGTWYYCESHGIMKTGWVSVNGSWYYLDPLAGGAMASGWLQPDKSTGTWYYCDPSGAMKTGWIHLDSGWYYLNSSGEMLANTTTPDGYYVDSNGVWIS